MRKAALVFVLLQLTGPGGQLILLDTDKVATLRTPRGEGHVAKEVHCLVFTVDGKNINVAETCAQVKKLMEAR